MRITALELLFMTRSGIHEVSAAWSWSEGEGSEAVGACLLDYSNKRETFFRGQVLEPGPQRHFK